MRLLVALLLAPAPALGRIQAQLLPREDTPLRTEGRYIVGRRGERVKWACVNWYGAYSETAVVGGLEEQPLERIVHRIIELGFNCVRLCYSTQAQIENPIVQDVNVAANPRFFGKRFFDVWDATVSALTSAGLMIIINNQVHRSGWCCHYTQNEGLWYVPGYPADIWVESVVNMTLRHKSDPLVVGIDLRNEVHDYRGTSLTWGDGDPETDWAAAATRAGNAVLAADPDVLVIVMALCFGMELRPAREKPIRLDIPGRLVYEVHNYLEYQVWSLISQSFISWLHIRIICATILLVALVTTGLLLWGWHRLGHIRPAVPLVAITFGAWLCGLGSVAAGVCKGLLIALSSVPACGYWGRRDVVPAMISCIALAAAGLLAAGAGFAWLRRREARAEALEDAQDSGSGEEESVSSDGALEASQVAGPRRRACAPGCRSCRALYRRLSAKGDCAVQTEWDCGLCCGLQCLVLCVATSLLMIAVFVFACFAGTYGLLEGHFDRSWGFILDEGNSYTAPVWIGEFGNSVPGFYWNNLMHYANQRDLDFAYWAINGKKWATGFIDMHRGHWVAYDHGRWSNETFGILDADYETVRRPWQLLDLQALTFSPARWRPRNRACSRSWSSACGG